MDNFGLPPFYVGQKVVALYGFPKYKKHGFSTPKKNVTYTVREVVKYGSKWCVRLTEIVNEHRRLIDEDGTAKFAEVAWVARYFKELETLPCGKLELIKVLEKVSEFVYPN